MTRWRLLDIHSVTCGLWGISNYCRELERLTTDCAPGYARKVLAVWPQERGLTPEQAEAEMARALAAIGTRNGRLPPGPVTVSLAGGATARAMVLPDTLSGRPTGIGPARARVAVQLR